MTVITYIKPTRHFAKAISDRLSSDLGMSLEKYLSLYKESVASREILKELAAVFFRLPPGDQVFKINTAFPEDVLLPLIMSISICPFFWDKESEAIYKRKILLMPSKYAQIKEIVLTANSKYPDMSFHTHTDLFRFLAVRLPPYTTAKLPERITSEELPDFLDAVGVGALLRRYQLDELLLAFFLIGYPVYANPSGEGWNVGLQILGAQTIAGALGRNAMVGRAKVNALNDFDSTEV